MARVWKFGDDVDTDQILPGRFAPYLQPEKKLGDFAFYEARPDFAAQACPGDLIVAGRNFGCGSSREYAPEALKRRGIAALIARSFARIFYRNGLNLGLPLLLSDELPRALQEGQVVELDRARARVTTADRIYALPPLSPFVTAILEAGDITAYVRAHGELPPLPEA